MKQNNNSFTDEANNANSIIAENTTSNINGKYWFWYVAPDDFSRNEGDWGKGDRVITATFEITLLNGNPITKRKHIFITRPPLMLVHGLIGKPSTWDKFPKDDKGNLFIDDSRFKIKPVAVKMDPTSHFSVNSSQLLAGNDCNNSFISIISEMRKTGYACNQVDYVCHSMGGSILRYAVDSINKENKSVFFTEKNYGHGYVNKLITLDTPHNGSSFANLLCDLLTDDISGSTATIVSLLGIEDLYDFNFSKNTVTVAEAVADLRYKNGIKFNETKIYSHLIGCGTSCLDYKFRANLILWTLASMIPQFDSDDKCNSMDNYFAKNSYESDFMEANDLIVSLKSQFSSNNIDFLPDNCTKLTGIMHTSIFGSSPTEDNIVGEKVNLLLNTDVNSNLFAYIPSTKIASSESPEKIVRQRFKFLNDKIKIIYPLPDATYNTGDTITLKLQVDTVGLKSFVLHFQDQFFFEVPVSPIVEYRLIVSPEYTEKQNIGALGNYFISDIASISSASIDLMVKQVGSLLDFNVIPEVIIIEKGKNKLPVYEAVFPNAIAQLGQTDSISVIVKDPNIVSYDIPTNRFIGVEKGTTSALVSYRGKSKTVFFEIIQYEEPPVDPITGIDANNIDNRNQFDVKVYPNPTKGIFTIATKEKEYELAIINIFGEKIIFQKIQNEKTEIDLSNQPNGIYLLHFTSKSVSVAKKIIIRK
ncbi:MAG: T9SS type A sorting domain-containing protein [Bacteroidales bacterium]|nr:T9SS type A sorting domain-containing protein [Bacteroidales bacterium]